MKTGKELKLERIAAGIKSKDMADINCMSASKQSKIENGKIKPDYDTMRRMEENLNLAKLSLGGK